MGLASAQLATNTTGRPSPQSRIKRLVPSRVWTGPTAGAFARARGLATATTAGAAKAAVRTWRLSIGGSPVGEVRKLRAGRPVDYAGGNAAATACSALAVASSAGKKVSSVSSDRVTSTGVPKIVV